MTDTSPPGRDAVEVHLTIEAGEPLSGTVRVKGGADARPFHGWLDLLAAINAAHGFPPGRTAQPPRTSDHDH
jgi:hypothetical protein